MKSVLLAVLLCSIGVVQAAARHPASRVGVQCGWHVARDVEVTGGERAPEAGPVREAGGAMTTRSLAISTAQGLR